MLRREAQRTLFDALVYADYICHNVTMKLLLSVLRVASDMPATTTAQEKAKKTKGETSRNSHTNLCRNALPDHGGRHGESNFEAPEHEGVVKAS